MSAQSFTVVSYHLVADIASPWVKLEKNTGVEKV
jgi:hypothetical protein